MDLKEQFKDFIKKEELLKKGQSILLGVSGGPDSLTMLDLFSRIKESFQLELVVFHLNHMFREEAEEEARFVKEVSSKYGLKAVIEKYDVPAYIRENGVSSEEAGRIIRFRLMKETLEKLNIRKLALAHNKDDWVETIFLHMIRGSGLRGLTGINPVTEMDGFQIIHPVLDIYREDIEKYCSYRDLKPKNDPTNKETIFTRNKIRHDIIPYIEKEINPGVKDVVVQMARIVREENNFLDDLAKEELNKMIIERKDREFTLSLNCLRKSALTLRRRIFKHLVYLLDPDYSDLYFNHYQILERFIHNSNTGKVLDLPGTLKVKKQYDRLILRMGNFRKKFAEYNLKLPVSDVLTLPDGRKLETSYLSSAPDWRSLSSDPRTCIFDADRAELPLIVRNRRPGDRFSPLGMNGVKKLKDFFIDEKIPSEERDKIPLVVDSSNRIIWIAGLRLDDHFKITDETKNYVRIKLK